MLLPVNTVTASPEATEAVGAALAAALRDDASLPRFVALYGDLGVGKTAFVRGFASEIAPAARVKSPTFALVHEYPAGPVSVFHFDMYRITDDDELYSIGFYDYFRRAGYMLVEWSENIPFALPDRYLRVEISKLPSAVDERRITIQIKQNDKELS